MPSKKKTTSKKKTAAKKTDAKVESPIKAAVEIEATRIQKIRAYKEQQATELNQKYRK